MSTPKKFKQAEKLYSQALEYNEQGNWGLSETEFMKALILYTNLKAAEKVAACHYSIGNVCFNKGNLDETRKHWEEALELYKKMNHSEAGSVCIDLGDLMYDQKELYGSGHFYSQALQLLERSPIGNEENFGIAHMKLGKVCYAQERYPAAEQHFLKAQPILEKHSREDLLADIFKCLGHIYLATNDLKIAKQNFMKSFQMFSKIGHEDGKNECASCITAIENKEKQRKLEKKSKKLEDQLKLLETLPNGLMPTESSESEYLGELKTNASRDSEDYTPISGTMAVPRAQVLPIGVTGLQPTNFPYRTYVPAPPNGRNQLQEIFTGLQQKQELSEKVQRQIVPEITRSNPLADKKTKKIPLKKRID